MVSTENTPLSILHSKNRRIIFFNIVLFFGVFIMKMRACTNGSVGNCGISRQGCILIKMLIGIALKNAGYKSNNHIT